MQFIIRDANRWTTFAAVIENNILNWQLDGRNVLVLVGLSDIDIANIDHLKEMARSMQDDILFLEANADDNDPDSINGQVKTLTNWLNLLNRYQAWQQL